MGTKENRKLDTEEGMKEGRLEGRKKEGERKTPFSLLRGQRSQPMTLDGILLT